MKTLTEIQDAAKMGNAVKTVENLSEFGNTFTAYFDNESNKETFYAFLPKGLTVGERKGNYYSVSVTF